MSVQASELTILEIAPQDKWISDWVGLQMWLSFSPESPGSYIQYTRTQTTRKRVRVAHWIIGVVPLNATASIVKSGAKFETTC